MLPEFPADSPPAPLRVLVLEDDAMDVELYARGLKSAGFDPQCVRVDTEEAFQATLSEEFDIVLAEDDLPGYHGLPALKFLQKTGWDIPFILISENISDESAVEAIHAGAEDYVIKDRLIRLGPAVVRAVRRKKLRQQQRQAEAEVKLQLQLLEQTSEVSGVGGWSLDLATQQLRWTRQTCAIHEVDPDFRPDLESALNFYAPESRPLIQAALEEAMRSGTAFDLELPFITAKGRSLWVRVQGRAVREKGVPIRLIGVFHDITEKRRSEMQMRLLESVVTHLRDTVLITEGEPVSEPGPRIVFVNPAFEKMTGYTREEVIGRSPRFLQSERTSRKELDRIRQALLANESVHAELNNRCKDGTEYWVEVSIVPLFSAAGACTHFVSLQRDVTNRKLTEIKISEQAALLDRANDAIIVLRLDQGITYWNRAAERIYGWSSSEASSLQFRENIHQDPMVFDRAMEHVLREGAWTGEMWQRTREGKMLNVDASWTLLRNESGKPEAVLVINTDATERKKLEQQFLRSQRMESLGTLASGIAHDLNNVLAPILLSIQSLREGEKNPWRLRILETIEASTLRGAEIIKQVLLFGRGVEGQHVSVSIPRLIQDMQRMIHQTFPKNITLKVHLDSGLRSVSGDPTQLHQVLLNLCVNARDAMPDGGQLTLSARNVDSDPEGTLAPTVSRAGPFVLLQVEDNGVGMSADILDKIFDPFFTTKELGKGTGLGLSTSLAIIKSHGGFIRVNSEPGKGTTFRVYMPAEGNNAVAEAEARLVKLPRGNGEIILVVDDEVSVREICRQTLETFGYKVLLANDGAEALSLFASQREAIDLVLTDMMMPVMDGPALIQVLKKLKPDLRIVAASGLNSNHDALKSASYGVTRFLAKPFSAETLLTTLSEALRGTVEGPPYSI
jgi:PAS domain S-box-containing protein